LAISKAGYSELWILSNSGSRDRSFCSPAFAHEIRALPLQEIAIKAKFDFNRKRGMKFELRNFKLPGINTNAVI
jgi:hypothetical protein